MDAVCGDDHPFRVFTGHDFTRCFEEVVIICPVYVLLTIITSYYIITSSCRPLRSGRSNRPSIIFLRFALQVFIVISEIILLVGHYLSGVSPSVTTTLAISLVLLAWSLSAVLTFLCRNTWGMVGRGRNRDLVIVVWVLALVSTSFELHSAILVSLHQKGSALDGESAEVREYMVVNIYVRWVLTLAVLLAQIPRSHIEGGMTLSAGAGLINDTEAAGSSRSISHLGGTPATPSEHSYSPLSRLVFHWVGEMFADARNNRFAQVRDLTFTLPPSMNPAEVHTKLKLALQKYQPRTSPELRLQDDVDGSKEDLIQPLLQDAIEAKPSSKYFLVKALNSAFGWSFWPLNIIKLVCGILELSSPVVLNLFLKELESTSLDIRVAGAYLAVLVAIAVCNTFIHSHLDYEVEKLEIRMKGSIITELYSKVLSVNTATLKRFTVGEITNFGSQDAEQMTDHLECFFEIWFLPLKLGVTFYLLYRFVGIAFLAGVGFCIVLIPINQVLSAKMSSLYDGLMEYRDTRVKLIHEIITNIKSIKMFSWEDQFIEKVNKLRCEELRNLRVVSYLDSLCVYFWACAPPLITFLTILTFSLLGNTVSVSVIFTTLALVQELIVPMNALPWVIMGFVYAWTSVKRITKFMSSPETSPQMMPVPGPYQPQNTIEVDRASFYWDNPEECCLVGLSFQVNKGELVVVMGRTGSGKSSLLLALSQELHLREGELRLKEWRDGTGLVLQEPWIKAGTIKENILDGCPFDLYWYEHVVGACALDKDIRNLPNGDNTHVGTSGGALSGGQKIRVSLARAVYKNKHVYLIDDIFSCLDSNVAVHIFEHCINGILANKTRIICTHHEKFSATADTLMVLEKGQISYIGLPQTSLVPQTSGTLPETDENDDGDRKKKKSDSDSDSDDSDSEEDKHSEYEEERYFGAVSVHVYKHYCKAAGFFLTAVVLFGLFGMQATDTLSNWWLSMWTKAQASVPHVVGLLIAQLFRVDGLHYADSFTPNASSLLTQVPPPPRHPIYTPDNNTTPISSNSTFYLKVYCGFIAANSVFTLIRAFGYAIFGITATSALHRNMLSSVMKTALHFFDSTPVGVILNRFSRDIYQCDIDLPFTFNNFLAVLFTMLGAVVMTCYGLPYVILTFIPMVIVYYCISRYYQNAVREVKRLFASTQSPLFTHFEQTVKGVQYIHAARQSDSTASKGLRLLRDYQRADFCLAAANSWLELRLQLLAAAVLAMAAGVILLEIHFQAVDIAILALALTYALSINESLVDIVRDATDVEKEFIGAERVLQYTFDLPVEYEPSEIQPVDITWPLDGIIEFKGVSVRYKNATSLALDNVDFRINSGEKVGIVGRTGAGKSTVLLALFRLCDVEKGCILVDSVNIHDISGKVLREKLSVLPQTPFIFEGSIKENLDPFEFYSEEVVRSALERCQLMEFVNEKGGIGAKIKYDSLSVGERQLLCLARALLHNSKVLCLDEATSGIDMETDKVIQQIIREDFSSATVLTIAHRLETIMDYDRILVLNEGKLVEDGAPHQLLENNKSLFYKLALSGGLLPHNSKLAASNYAFDDAEASSSSFPDHKF